MATFYSTNIPSGSSNASIGTNGGIAPTSSTEVGGIGADGNLHGLSTDNSGVLNVNATSSVLPTGAATAANQVTGNNSLASIDTKTPALGQALAAASVPVVLTAAQLSTLNPLSTVTANQGTATGGTAWPVSLASVPLPTGAATSALQTTGNTSLASIDTKTPSLGQAVMASSSPVVISSDQSLPTGLVRSATGNLTATSQTVVINPSGAQTIVCQLSGTFSGTVTFETSEDAGTTWTSLFAWDQGNVGFSATGNVSGRIYTMPAYGNSVRARCSAYASGTIVVTLLAGKGSMPASYVSPVTFFPIQGNVAEGATATGTNPVLVGGLFQTSPATITDGKMAYMQTDNKQNILVNIAAQNATSLATAEIASGTATLTNVASSASSVSILASNANRKMAMFYNDSTQIIYLKLGATASNSSYTVQIPANGYYELTNGKVYTGAIDGIWASANGNLRITELT